MEARMSETEDDPFHGDLPSTERLHEAFALMAEKAFGLSGALDNLGKVLRAATFVLRIRLAYQRRSPWILHHMKCGFEYTVAGYRREDEMFLIEIGDDGLRRAIPMAHVVSGHYALWGN